MNKLAITALRPEDLERAAQLVASLPLYQRYGLDRTKAHRLLSTAAANETGDELRGAVLAGKLVGVAWVIPKGGFGRSAYLRLLAVAPAHLGQGIGRQLIEAVEHEHLMPNGVIALCAEDNYRARKFYRQRGYAEVGQLPGYVLEGVNEVLLYKSAGGRESSD